MADVFDVASYVLEQKGEMTAMKLQKLVYYSQAWSTVWDDNIIFKEQIEAWVDGPVVRELWNSTKGKFRIGKLRRGDSNNLSRKQKKTIDAVIEFYGDKGAQWLSNLTHLEKPWKNAYFRGRNTIITPYMMERYYSKIQ